MLESMELEEKKVTHDFLSLYAADSSFEPEDPRSASQGFYLKTRDFLQPLDDGREQGGGRSGEMAAEKAVTGGAVPSCTGHSGDARVRTGDARQPDTTPVRVAIPIGFEAKPEPDYGSWSTTTSYGSYAGVPYGVWDDKTAVCREQWPSPIIDAAHGNGTGTISATTTATSSQRRLTPEMKGTYKEVDNDEVLGKRKCSSSHTDMTIKVHGRGSSLNEPRPNTPRSKHSATEQRRRTKINDSRFQIMRQIIPHSDQKRDKASFLMEVIEYIRFLQEKVQRYEAPSSTWNQDAAKLMPWKSSQPTSNGLSIPDEVIKTDPDPPHLFSTNCIDGIVPVTIPPSGKQSSATTGIIAGISHKTELAPTCPSNLAFTQTWLQPRWFDIPKENCIAQPQRKLILNQDSMQDRPLITSSRLTDNMDKERFRLQEQLIIDDGTISISNTYSHGLLNTLAQALQSSGVDLSHAGISVQINLGKRALNRTTATSATSTFKGCKRFDYSSVGNSIEQSKAPKRSKLENS
ncbi:transcription factor BIM2-like isoform X1 [Zingiber officinale]|uniref:transcription factor BIM2-like isoform X1 n=1 Tax=Zingiber officinale TaxID=94328 RepID=UPI001C4D10A6|nr:transcription factor BIM2-like isoform X1 [Zingiber officinale]